MTALHNGELQLFKDLINEKVQDGQNSSISPKTKGGKLINIEEQYNDHSDKTLLQVANDVENINKDFLKLCYQHSIFQSSTHYYIDIHLQSL